LLSVCIASDELALLKQEQETVAEHLRENADRDSEHQRDDAHPRAYI
jgi:hypothetical protein